jgi:hypothetical protein
MAQLIVAGAAFDMVSNVHPQNGKYFTLKEMYSLLDCEMVQAVNLYDGRILWLDEEGKRKSRYLNIPATQLLYASGGMREDYITGNVLITSQDEVQ